MSNVSIVLPTYNRLNRLKHVLVGLEKQIYPLSNVEIVVVSDGSSDGTHEYLQAIDTSLNLRFFFQSNQGVAAARNHGLRQATGDVVLFIDDDVVPAPQLISEHMRIHAEHQGDVVVLGPMLTPPDFAMSAWVRWEQAMLAKQYGDMIAGRWQPTARQFYTGNTSLARQHLLAVGGFDETFYRAEDVELAYRLAERGLRFIFNSDAVGYHYAERSFRSWMEIPYVYGRNDVIFTHRKGQYWLLSTIMREFNKRNLLIRLLVRVCLGRSLPSTLAITGLRYIAEMGDRLEMQSLPRMAYSGIFNLRYCQGVADELDSPECFFTLIPPKSIHLPIQFKKVWNRTFMRQQDDRKKL